MKTILLLGELGKKFGRKHRFDVKSPAEAIRALIANFKGLEAHLMGSDPAKVRYRVIVGNATLPDETRLHDPVGEEETIRFVPVFVGAGGGGVLQTIVGAVLIIAGTVAWFVPGGQAVAPYLWTMGAAMMIGGVVQMLSPVPKTPTGVTADSTQTTNNPSYAFNGPVNVSAQGAPVPIGYGKMIVGSCVISAGITTEEY